MADNVQNKDEEHDPHYEPVLKLTEQVETKTHEEDEDPLFKMRAKLFRFEMSSTEWKERGTGDVRLLQHRVTRKIRLVMRRDKTLKVCANHAITADMKLQPNVGSDRSWVWKVAADYSEQEPTSETLAIRFANAENAQAFKTEFEKAQILNSNNGKESNQQDVEGITSQDKVVEVSQFGNNVHTQEEHQVEGEDESSTPPKEAKQALQNEEKASIETEENQGDV